MNVGKKAHEFLGKAAPAGYVAGLGRGDARGFVTGSDVVPIQPGEMLAASRNIDPLSTAEDTVDNRELNEERDEYGLLSASSAAFSVEDQEAVETYDRINQRMSSRCKIQKPSTDISGTEIQKIKNEFSSLKQSMNKVSEVEWANLPEPVTIVKKKRKENPRETFLPVPDSVILNGLNQDSSFSNIVDDTVTNVMQFKEAREKALDITLEKASCMRLESGIDTNLFVNSSIDYAELKKSRALYKSITFAAPKNVSAWMAYAKAEENANNLREARKILRKGLEECPRSEELWIELVKLHSECKATDYDQVIFEASSKAPNCEAIWLLACDREKVLNRKQELFKKALEHNPKSISLWKSFIETEDKAENAKILLQNAVECVTDSVDFWIALAKLETNENSRKVLNKAVASCPPSIKIWIEAMKLEENNPVKLADLLDKAICNISCRDVNLLPNRNEWIQIASDCEKESFLNLARTIIKQNMIFHIESDSGNWKNIWMQEVEFCKSNNAICCAREIFSNSVLLLPEKRSLWKRWGFFEQQFGNLESFENVMSKGTALFPQYELLWLIYAKYMWTAHSADSALVILSKAIDGLNSEILILAKFKVLLSVKDVNECRQLLETFRKSCDDCPKVWLKLIVLERNMKNFARCIELLKEAVAKFPTYFKFYLMYSQLLEKDDVVESIRIVDVGTRKCQKSVSLWIKLADLEQSQNMVIKARSTLERARSLNPSNEQLWLASVKLEVASSNISTGKSLLNKALKECPSSGLLHYYSIFLEMQQIRLLKAMEYFKRLGKNPWITFAIALIFAEEKNIEKCLYWFDKTIELNRDESLRIADFYLHYYSFLQKNSLLEKADKIKEEFCSADCVYGELWIKYRKEPNNWLLTNEDIFELAAKELLG